jgi:hypothetical protein
VASLICKKLPLGSLLALRETCKTTREWVDVENRSTLTEALKEIKIELGMPGDLSRFLSEVRNLPFSNFKLNIQSCDNYWNRHVIQFLDRYGPIARRLTVSSFWKCASDVEWYFYESLQSLEQLVIDEMVLPSSGVARIPSCIQKIKLLDISSSSEEFEIENDIPYCFQLFEAAKELETFTPCAVVYFDSLCGEEINDQTSLEKYLRHFMESWERRSAGLGSVGDETLQTINWYNVGVYYDDWFEFVLPMWLTFIRKLLDCPANIMMHRVSSEMLGFEEDQPQLWSQFAERIVSCGPIEWIALNAKIPNLEIWKLHNADNFRATFSDFGHPEWPKLKEIYTDDCAINLVT